MGWPQIVMIVIGSIGIGVNLVKHGERRTDKYNVWVSIIGCAIEAIILYFGGFWG